jgi:NAD(P)-dependent dehydrogenase (short-subunit alcohol dehydrogenase family)
MPLLGLGVAIVKHLALKGANVVLTYTSDSSTKAANEIAEEVKSKHGVRCTVVKTDIGSTEGPKEIVSAAKEAFTDPATGAFQIDIIINNAGYLNMQEIGDITMDAFQNHFFVNVRGPMFLVQEALPYLPHDRSGRIVNISSTGSRIGFWGQACYGGTKAALEAVTRTWARELAERATVNCVNPGAIDVGMYLEFTDEMIRKVKPFNEIAPLAAPREGIDEPRVVKQAEKTGGRSGYPDEIAGVVGILCLPEAGWTTGCCVGASGGSCFHQ